MPLLSDRDLLARLVSFDSTSHRSNRDFADAVCDYLDRPEVTIEKVSGGDEGKVNLIARCGPEPVGEQADDQPGVTFCGHLDVVPATEPQWLSDPFELVERDETFVARGACDMKGFVAVAMNRFIQMASVSLRAPLALLLTCDEELGSLGAQRMEPTWSSRPPLPTATWVGEPTSLTAVRLHKGHLSMRVVLSGVAAHSGSPHLGQNAIEPVGPLLVALAQLRAELARQRPVHHEFFPTVPFTVLNVSTIAGGAAVNVVPERCVIELGVRLLPGQSSGPLIEGITQLAEQTTEGRAAVEVINDNPPMESAEDAAIHRWLCSAVDQQDSRGVSFASDAGVLSRLGMECVLFGPGSIEVAHRPNEFVPIDELERCGTIVERLVHEWCG